MTFKKDKILIDYIKYVTELYEDHDRSKDDTHFHVLELNLDMALAEIELELLKRKVV